MDFYDYQILTHQVAGFVEAGDYEAALGVLRELVNSDISELDKSLMCLNVAVVYDKMQQPDEALRWYDEGMRWEAPHGRFFVAEQKAAFLLKAGRALESLRLYSQLLESPAATEHDKERLRHNEKVARDSL